MKILLVRPIVANFKRLNAVPPIGLGYLSSALKKAGFEVKITDCVAKNYNFKDLSKTVQNEDPSILGFQAFSQDVDAVNRSINIAKKINPGIITIVGGAHSSGVGQKIYQHMPEVDLAFQGEGEVGLVQLSKIIKQKRYLDLVSSDELASVPGLIWRKNGHIYSNPPVFINNLDELDFPDWELINPNSYPHAPQGVIFKNLPVAPIIATRGCPFPCTFCAGYTISGRAIRKRSIENIISEIKLLNNCYKVKEIHIVDDNFTFNKDYVRNFCLSLLENNLKISWCCPNGLRLDTLTEDVVRLMKESGCYYISVGIESGVDRILKAMRKELTVEQIRQQVLMVKRAGMDVNGFFIIGYPGETAADIRKTIDFAKSLPLTRVAFYNFLPLPSTQIYKILMERNELKEINYNDFFQGDVPYVAQGFSKGQLKYLQRRAFREFYLRPGVFFSLISKIKSFNQLLYIIRRAMVYF